MSHRSPLVTVAGTVVAFAALIAANMIDDARHPEAAPTGATTTSASPTSAVPTETPPTSVPPPSLTPTPGATKSAASDKQFPRQVVYAGRTRDRSVALAVAVLGDKAAAYVCDGRTVEAWLRGSAEDGRLELSGSRGAKLEAELDAGSTIKGRVRVDGRWLVFEIGVAKPPAGLYRAKGSTTTIGWIVLPDGSQVGVESKNGSTKAAPELDPGNPKVTANGEQLHAAPVTGDAQI